MTRSTPKNVRSRCRTWPSTPFRKSPGQQYRGDPQRKSERPPSGRCGDEHGQARRQRHRQRSQGRLRQSPHVPHQCRHQHADDQRDQRLSPATAAVPRRRAGQAEAGQEHAQGILSDPVEDQRGNQGIEDATQHAPDRDRQVIRRQVARPGPEPGQLAVADHRGHEEREQVERNPERLDQPRGQYRHQCHHRQRQGADHQRMRHQRPPCEDQDEREQVER